MTSARKALEVYRRSPNERTLMLALDAIVSEIDPVDECPPTERNHGNSSEPGLAVLVNRGAS